MQLLMTMMILSRHLQRKSKVWELENLDLVPEFTSNNLLNVDDGLVCTVSLLTDNDIIEQFTRNDDDDECGSDNDEDGEMQVMKPTKTSLHSAIDTRHRLCLTMNSETRFAD